MPNNNINKVAINSALYSDIKARFCHNDGFDFNDLIPMPSHIFRGSLGPNARELYGADNWYDWSIENWGTKWNAYDIYWDDDNCELSFYTAWNAPIPIMCKLSALYPAYAFEWFCEDEGGWYSYEATYLNGEEVEHNDLLPDEDEDEDEVE